jgi:hypothetical protein
MSCNNRGDSKTREHVSLPIQITAMLRCKQRNEKKSTENNLRCVKV